MQLLNLELHNWCQHRKLYIPEFDDKSIAISGDNNKGKSNVVRAIGWLLDSGNSEYGGKESITDGETWCQVQADVRFGTVTHTLVKRIENSGKDNVISFHLDDIKITAKQWNAFLQDRIGTDNFLSLLISRQEDIHAPIRAPKTARNRQLRELLGLDAPEEWGKHLSKLFQVAAIKQARQEGADHEAARGMRERESDLANKVNISETKKSEQVDPLQAQGMIDELERGIEFLKERKQENQKLGELQTQNSTDSLKLMGITSELEKLKGEDPEALRKEKEENHKETLLAAAGASEQNARLAEALNGKQPASELEPWIKGLEDIQTPLAVAHNAVEEAKATLARKTEAITGKEKEEHESAFLWETYFQKYPLAKIAGAEKLNRTGLHTSLAMTAGLKKMQTEEARKEIPPVSAKESLQLLPRLWETLRNQAEETRKDPTTGEAVFQGWNQDTFEARMKHLGLKKTEEDNLPHKKGDISTLHQLERETQELEVALANIPDTETSKEQALDAARRTNEFETAKKEMAAREETLSRLNSQWKEKWGDKLPSQENLVSARAKHKALEETARHRKDADTKMESLLEVFPGKEKTEIITDALNAYGKKEAIKEKAENLETRLRTALNNENLKKPKQEEKTRTEAAISTRTTQISAIQETQRKTPLLKLSYGEFSMELLPTKEILEIEEIKTAWKNKKEASSKAETELQTLRKELTECKALTLAAEKKLDQTMDNGKLLGPLEELKMFLSAKQAPEILLRSAMTTILAETNRILPLSGLEVDLRMDSGGDFECIYQRDGRTVVEPARRQGVGYATLMGMAMKLAITKIVCPNLRMVIFDEPSGALSPARRNMLSNFFRNLTQHGETRQVMVIEHDPLVAESCQQTIRIENVSRQDKLTPGPSSPEAVLKIEA